MPHIVYRVISAKAGIKQQFRFIGQVAGFSPSCEWQKTLRLTALFWRDGQARDGDLQTGLLGEIDVMPARKKNWTATFWGWRRQGDRKIRPEIPPCKIMATFA